MSKNTSLCLLPGRGSMLPGCGLDPLVILLYNYLSHFEACSFYVISLRYFVNYFPTRTVYVMALGSNPTTYFLHFKVHFSICSPQQRKSLWGCLSLVWPFQQLYHCYWLKQMDGRNPTCMLSFWSWVLGLYFADNSPTVRLIPPRPCFQSLSKAGESFKNTRFYLNPRYH